MPRTPSCPVTTTSTVSVPQTLQSPRPTPSSLLALKSKPFKKSALRTVQLHCITQRTPSACARVPFLTTGPAVRIASSTTASAASATRPFTSPSPPPLHTVSVISSPRAAPPHPRRTLRATSPRQVCPRRSQQQGQRFRVIRLQAAQR